MKRLNFIAAAGIMALGAAIACSPEPGDTPPAVVKGGKGGKGGAGGSDVKGGSGGKTVTEPMAGKGGTPEGGAGGKGGEGGSAGGQAGGGGENLIGLVGQWRFEEGQGAEAKDSSGSGNDGTVVAGAIESAPVAEAPKWTTGRSGKALELNGTNQWIRVPSSESINTTGTNGAVTMAAWVKANKFDETGDDFNFVMSRHEIGSAFDHFGLGLLAGRPAMSVHFFSAVGASVISVDDKWHHIVGTYDGITMSVYLDGESVAATDIGFSIAGDTTNLVIGGNQNIDVVKELWGGALDNVSLYNRALSLSEVKNLFDAAP